MGFSELTAAGTVAGIGSHFAEEQMEAQRNAQLWLTQVEMAEPRLTCLHAFP